MDWSLIVFIAIVLSFAFSGYKAGVFSIASRVISLPTAYIITLFFTKDVGQWLQTHTELEGLMAYIVGGSTLFIISSATISLIFSTFQKLFINKDIENSPLSAITGALLNAAIGVFFGFLIIWFTGTLQTIYFNKNNKTAKVSNFSATVQNIASKTISSVSNKLTEKNIISETTAVLLANPAENIERVSQISKSGTVNKLFTSHDSMTALESLSPSALRRSESFQNFVNDKNFIELAKEMNFSSDVNEMQKEVAVQVTTLWAKIEKVKNNPNFIELIKDSEIKNMIESKNVYQMMNSTKIENLINIITSVEIEPIEYVEEKIQSEKEEATKPKEVKIYRWVDEKGKVHFSDKPQKNK